MEASCQCGAVCFTTPLPQPLALYVCHCEGCRKQSGRPTGSGATLFCYFCQNCGTRLIHATPNKNVVSIKGGCLSNLDWSKAIHIWTRTAMVPIPEGSEAHSEESDHTDYGGSHQELDQPGVLTGSGEVPGWSAHVRTTGCKAKEGLCELSGTHTGLPGGDKLDYAEDQHHLL